MRQGSFETDNSHENAVSQINWFAQHEGWGVFNGGEIQRDDEMGYFDSDDEAVEHVKRLAEGGSMLHQVALAQHVAWVREMDDWSPDWEGWSPQ
jgi:hypothetical protein